MGINQRPCEPLDFEGAFLKLVSDMDRAIHKAVPGSAPWEKLVRYQTLMVNGAYLGLRAKELLNLTWYDVIGQTENTIFQFKNGPRRKVYFAKTQISYNDQNFKRLNPVDIHQLILHRQGQPTSAIDTDQFNKAFAKYLKKFGVQTPTPSSHTLRKTHMQYAWQLLSEQEGEYKAYYTVAKMLGYKSPRQVMDYLCHTHENIKEAVARMK